MATSYGLAEFESRWCRELSLLHVVQTGSRVYLNSSQREPPNLSTEVKRPGREADRSLPTSAEVKKIWIYTSILPYAFMM
jgi:hypothetical protein